MNAIAAPKRTDGDGMENSIVIDSNYPSEISKYSLGKTPNLRDQLIYRPTDLKISSTQPPVIQGKIVELVPKNINHARKENKLTLSAMSAREPKFVPYEPYKAAVKPIIPKGKTKVKKKVKISDPCLPEIKTNLLEGTSKLTIESETSSNNSEWEAERSILDEELKQLRQDNEQLESQLKFQAQVILITYFVIVFNAFSLGRLNPFVVPNTEQ